MATQKRTFPNQYFAWYNDDKRVAVLALDLTTDSTESTNEAYDTYQDSDVSNGLRITYHSKYETIAVDGDTPNYTGEMSSTHGVDTGMQNALLCYVKARLFEDQGDLQQAQYFRQMYEKSVKQYPSRKSGVRQLSVPRL
jgi:hypothetical protein|tara:strand:- start:466 stop:882 length:417 start_codon:yes stop_codon:yes gene_type:complete